MEGLNKQNSGEDKHFHMSKDYEGNSSSQKMIGKQVIESTSLAAKFNFENPDELQVLDLACGPGNLTVDLKNKLQETFPNTKMDVTGLDYSPDNVELLVKNSNGDISGVVGSFYDLPIKKESINIITSNEGLHWQPPYKMSEVIYSQLPKEEKEKYESWALENFNKAMQNIFDSLKKDGIAVLQFGHEGQLQKLWDIVKETLEEEQFKNYKSEVNFPLYYPKLESIYNTLLETGFDQKNISIKSFNQDLTESTPESISGFLQAFSRPGFSQFFKKEDLDAFYNRIEEKLRNMNVDDFRKNEWHRTLIELKK